MGDIVGNIVVLVLGTLFIRFVVRVFRSGLFGTVLTIALIMTIGYGALSGWTSGSALVAIGALVLYWFLGSAVSSDAPIHVSPAPRDAYNRRPGDPNWNQGPPGPSTNFR